MDNRESAAIKLEEDLAAENLAQDPYATKLAEQRAGSKLNETSASVQLVAAEIEEGEELARAERGLGSDAVFGAVKANLPDHFEVLELIGQGGAGDVFKVFDRRTNDIFAIKLLRSQLLNRNNDSQLRFEREATAAQQLTHPNLAAIFHSGIGKQGIPYLVMEYLEGTDLEKLIKAEKCIDVPRAVDIFIQIAESLEHAHAKGIIHRDVKSSNIIIQKVSEGAELAKLVDFGIASDIMDEQCSKSGSGAAIGSPPYMSPEQCAGERTDARSDIYSLGCVMYEALVGEPPFGGENPVSIILKHLKKQAVPPAKAAIHQKIPPVLSKIIVRCLEKDPADRYQSASELRADLDGFSKQRKVQVKGRRHKFRFSLKNKWLLMVIPIIIAAALYGVSTGGLVLKYFSGAFNSILSMEYYIPDKQVIYARDGNAAMSMAERYFKRGAYDAAIPLIEFALKSGPTHEEQNAELASNSKLARANQGKWYALKYYLLGKCYAKTLQLANAEHYFQLALPYFANLKAEQLDLTTAKDRQEFLNEYVMNLTIQGKDGRAEEIRKLMN